MTNSELLEKLNLHLKEVDEMFSLAELGLLKSDELYSTKYKIEDNIKAYKPFFEKIECLKIEKAISIWRTEPRRGMFLDSSQALPQLFPLQVLLHELIAAKDGQEQVIPVTTPDLTISGSTINRAIADAKTLLTTQGATSAFDRVHTVLHGYMKQVCIENSIIYPADPTLNQLLNELKLHHPALKVRNENIDQILKSLGNVLDKLNPLRNNSSLAHPNATLLDPEEAMLAINTVNTILSYLNTRLMKVE